MKQLRAACPRQQADQALPIEAIYADETDFIISSCEVIAAIEPAAIVALGEWNLAVNTEKIDLTILQRQKTKGDETWR